MRAVLLLLSGIVVAFVSQAVFASDRIPLTVEHHQEGAPLTVGIPFPKGVLHSPDQVRLLSADGIEIPAQVTEVSTWEPADPSIKWIWVFFFATDTDQYLVEYGEDVQRAPIAGNRIQVVNNQRQNGFVEIDTGAMRFLINTGEGGFFDELVLRSSTDPESEIEVASGLEGRGSFVDLVEGEAADGEGWFRSLVQRTRESAASSSTAVVHRTWVDQGSGPLHVIVRVEGEYRYPGADKNASPFEMRIHAYAGQSYVRVFHTLTYTGDPDQCGPIEGEYADIATQRENIVDEEALRGNDCLTQPGDQIAGAGLSLTLELEGDVEIESALREGPWWEPQGRLPVAAQLAHDEDFSLVQLGPEEPFTPSTAEERIEGFRAEARRGADVEQAAARGEGWLRVSDAQRGIAVGIRNFLEEYPKEFAFDSEAGVLTAYVWSPAAGPMSFARHDTEPDAGMVGNFAQGLAKTTELIYYFHEADRSTEDVRRVMNYVLDPPVGHAPPSWYAESLVFGRLAPGSTAHSEFERGLAYKFAWWRFNQHWEPWYGMFNYGDGMTYYYNDRWIMWNKNEPAVDFMWWLAFVRSGDRTYYRTAEDVSRHTMDVGNIHWPRDPEFIGDTNSALHAWEFEQLPPGSPYVGMGRRHARQHWTSLLSAHVWVQGWLASYYLSGYHRGLDVAKMTADYYLRRVFGEHSLTGRRLYLSVWNLVEVWDATKDEAYFNELLYRVDRMLSLQQQQGGSLVIDRYGYSQGYASHGLWRFHQMTGDEQARRALLRHARRVRDVPPRNHEMESYLATIHSLLVGYEFSDERSFLDEALTRAQFLRTDALPGVNPFNNPDLTQAELAEMLESVSHLPHGRSERPPIWKITNGLRVFGWTHAFNVPYLLYWLEHDGDLAGDGRP